MALTTITAKQAAYVTRKLLKVGEVNDIYGNMGVAPLPRKDTVPAHASTNAKWRRYEHLPTTPKVLVEGVTGDASTLTPTDLDVTLVQYGDYVILTDLSVDTVEDPLLSITGERQGDQAIAWLNTIREGVLVAGTTVSYANGSARTDVNTLLTKALVDKMTRTLSLNKARKLTKILAATQGYNTTPIPASYIGVVSTWVRYDIENTIGESGGYTPGEKYSQSTALMPGEFGKLGQCRFKENPDMDFIEDGGGNKGATHKSTTGVKEDVFFTLIFGEESYGIVQFGGYGGKDGVKSYVETSGGTSDPLHQRNTVGFKFMQNCKRLNELWFGRIETGATA